MYAGRFAWRHVPKVLSASSCTIVVLDRRPLRCDVDDRSSTRLTCFGEAMFRYVPDPSAAPVGSAGSHLTSRWLKNPGGAELNLTVALANLGWGGRARWVSVVPQGLLGDELLQRIGEAYPDGQGQENLKLVRREDGDVGTYHVWPAQKKIWFQRHNSAFGKLNPDWFDEDFWVQLLAEPVGDGSPAPLHVLHLTGITPFISANTHRAWWKALRAVRTVREDSTAGCQGATRIIATLDFNHRPFLGAWEDLWIVVEPHLSTVDLFVLSIGDIIKLGALLHIHKANELKDTLQRIPQGMAGAKDLNSAVQRALLAVQRRVGHKTNIIVTCKCRDTEQAGEVPTQLRFSMVCLKNGVILSTFDTAVVQKVREEIGGGDSWLSGCIDGLVGAQAPALAAPDWTANMWLAALRRGDMLAALKQRIVGDFSTVTHEQLDAAVAAHQRGELGVVS